MPSSDSVQSRSDTGSTQDYYLVLRPKDSSAVCLNFQGTSGSMGISPTALSAIELIIMDTSPGPHQIQLEVLNSGPSTTNFGSLRVGQWRLLQ